MKTGNCRMWRLLCLVMALAFSTGADTLSLEAYIGLALENNPAVAGARAGVASSEAAYRGSRSKLLPQVNGRAQAGRSSSNSAAPGSTATSDQLSVGVSASQRLFDFGQTTSGVRQSGRLLAAAREDETGERQAIVLNAKTAYFNYLLKQLLAQVAAEALKLSQQHLDEARVQFETGKQARYAVTKAEVDVANAQVALITAANGLRLAGVTLETAAGIALPGVLVLSDSLNVRENDITIEQALADADSNRPELRSVRLRLEAAQLKLRAQRAAYLPSFDASAGLGYGSYNGSDWRENWNIGASASVPIFEGGGIKASADQASAAVSQTASSLEQSRQSVEAEVKQRLLEKQDAQERISAAAKYVAQALEGLTMSQERYRAGAAIFMEVTDAEVALATARNSQAQALFDYRVAHARLLKAMGTD